MQKYENKGDNSCINCRCFNRIFNQKNSDSTDGTVMVKLLLFTVLFFIKDLVIQIRKFAVAAVVC